jgi:hypothetical protein
MSGPAGLVSSIEDPSTDHVLAFTPRGDQGLPAAVRVYFLGECRTPPGAFPESEPMSTAKEEVRKILDLIPDDSSFEDIHYHIYVQQKMQQAYEDVEAGRTFSQEEAEARMAEWLERYDGPQPR